MSTPISSLLAECAGLLGDIDETMAQTFADVLRDAAHRPATGVGHPFPLGPDPTFGSASTPATAAATQLVTSAAAAIGWAHPPEEFVPPGWAHGAAAATLIGPGATVEGTDSAVFGLFFMGPGLDYPDHWHDAEEFYLVLGGSAEWTVDGTTAVYGAGDYVRTPSQAVHRIVTGDQPMLAMWGWAGDTSFDTYGY